MEQPRAPASRTSPPLNVTALGGVQGKDHWHPVPPERRSVVVAGDLRLRREIFEEVGLRQDAGRVAAAPCRATPRSRSDEIGQPRGCCPSRPVRVPGVTVRTRTPPRERHPRGPRPHHRARTDHMADAAALAEEQHQHDEEDQAAPAAGAEQRPSPRPVLVAGAGGRRSAAAEAGMAEATSVVRAKSSRPVRASARRRAPTTSAVVPAGGSKSARVRCQVARRSPSTGGDPPPPGRGRATMNSSPGAGSWSRSEGGFGVRRGTGPARAGSTVVIGDDGHAQRSCLSSPTGAWHASSLGPVTVGEEGVGVGVHRCDLGARALRQLLGAGPAGTKSGAAAPGRGWRRSPREPRAEPCRGVGSGADPWRHGKAEPNLRAVYVPVHPDLPDPLATFVIEPSDLRVRTARGWGGRASGDIPWRSPRGQEYGPGDRSRRATAGRRAQR